MILLAVLFHNIQFVLFHLLAEVLPDRKIRINIVEFDYLGGNS